HLDACLLRASTVEVVAVHVGHEQRVSRGGNDNGGVSERRPMRQAIFEAVEKRRIIVAEIEHVPGARAGGALPPEGDGTGETRRRGTLAQRFSAGVELLARDRFE